jgi:hypothetical protein
MDDCYDSTIHDDGFRFIRFGMTIARLDIHESKCRLEELSNINGHVLLLRREREESRLPLPNVHLPRPSPLLHARNHV